MFATIKSVRRLGGAAICLTLAACASSDGASGPAPASYASGKYLDFNHVTPTGELDGRTREPVHIAASGGDLAFAQKIGPLRPVGYTHLDEQCAKAAQGPFGSDLQVETCTKALAQPEETSDNQALAAYHLALIHTHRHQYREALEMTGTALRLDPSLADAHLARATALIELGRMDEARRAISQALRGHPEYPHYAYYLRGVIHDVNNEFVPAYLDLRQAVEMRPGWVPAKQRLSFISQATDVQKYLSAKGD